MNVTARLLKDAPDTHTGRAHDRVYLVVQKDNGDMMWHIVDHWDSRITISEAEDYAGNALEHQGYRPVAWHRISEGVYETCVTSMASL